MTDFAEKLRAVPEKEYTLDCVAAHGSKISLPVQTIFPATSNDTKLNLTSDDAAPHHTSIIHIGNK